MTKTKKRKVGKQSAALTLQKQAEALWKSYCHQRDGRGCQVKKRFPELQTKHSAIYQVDHCFSRSNKELFLDICNGTVICSYCNLNKKHNKAIDLAINDIVIKREGQDTFNRMREIASRRGAFVDWKNISWLETQVEILKTLNELYRKVV